MANSQPRCRPTTNKLRRNGSERRALFTGCPSRFLIGCRDRGPSERTVEAEGRRFEKCRPMSTRRDRFVSTRKAAIQSARQQNEPQTTIPAAPLLNFDVFKSRPASPKQVCSKSAWQAKQRDEVEIKEKRNKNHNHDIGALVVIYIRIVLCW